MTHNNYQQRTVRVGGAREQGSSSSPCHASRCRTSRAHASLAHSPVHRGVCVCVCVCVCARADSQAKVDASALQPTLCRCSQTRRPIDCPGVLLSTAV
jgi:hypothetical protein